MSLTRQIHAELQSKGLMAVEPKPMRDELLGRARKKHHGRHKMPWESPFDKQPRDYAVTALVPHCNTPRLLKLCLGFLMRQTVPVYVVVVDTGTEEKLLPDVLALRSERVEIHQVNCHGTDHAVATACYAMDLGTAVCRTEWLWCVHSDCFVTRRTFLAELLDMAGSGAAIEKKPCIGYQTIPKPQSPGVDGSQMVSHTCTLLHVPTLDDLDATWSMRRLSRQAAKSGRHVELDTEMAINYRLLERGVKPIILGPETLDAIEIDANRVHLRAATAQSMYLGRTRDNSALVERLEKLLADDGDALPEQGEVGSRKSEVGNLRTPKYHRPDTLNLIYHVAPFAKSDVWRKNIRQLLKRWDVFNGRRIIAIATGPEMAPPSEVEQALSDPTSDLAPPIFLRVPNDGTLRENASFFRLLEAVQSTDPAEATFYAHAKGVATIGDAEGVMYWRNLMYHALLDDPETVKELLTRHAIVGTHRITKPTMYPNGDIGKWHFAGTYFWFRHDLLFGKPDWRDRLPRHGWGVEAFPAEMFALDESCCLAMDEPANAYDPATYPAELRFADDNGPGASAALKIELGGGVYPKGDGFVNVDMLDCADVRFDFDDLPEKRLPFDDGSAQSIYSSHCLEHVADYRPLLREIVRIGAVGCRVEIRVPHWNHNMAMCYTHKHTITYEQVEHWCETAIPFWFGGCQKRLRHVWTTRIPSRNFQRMKRLHPGWSDDEIMEHVPDTCHEYRFILYVVENAA